jgi:hypothetical protein
VSAITKSRAQGLQNHNQVSVLCHRCRPLRNGSILLNRPPYYGGTQVVLGAPHTISSWLEMLTNWPSSATRDKVIVSCIIKQQLDGYVGATDVPVHGIVEELLDVSPNSKVICTLHDPKLWAKSMQVIAGVCQTSFLRFALLPLE